MYFSFLSFYISNIFNAIDLYQNQNFIYNYQNYNDFLYQNRLYYNYMIIKRKLTYRIFFDFFIIFYYKML